jgi:hypothetical protein
VHVNVSKVAFPFERFPIVMVLLIGYGENIDETAKYTKAT